MTDTRLTETTSLWSGGEPSRAPIGLLAPGTSLGERYEIRAVLGHGGFAVVYLAHDREPGARSRSRSCARTASPRARCRV